MVCIYVYRHLIEFGHVCEFLFSMCGRLRGILITDTSCGGVLNKRRRLDGLKILTLPMIPVSIFHKYFCGAPATCAQYTIVRISQ